MPYNNFKLFDSNKANLLSDTEYSNSTQRLNGVQTGVASSQLQNKFAYQVSLVALAITQIMNQNGLDATDTLPVSTFVGNLGGSLLQKVADRASSAEAVAGVLANKYISPATMKAAALLLSGGVMNGTLDMNNNQIINLPTPTSNSEPATKEYVDGGQFFNYKRKLLSSDYFAKDKYTNSFTMPSASEIGNEFNGLYVEFEFVNYINSSSANFGITLSNYDDSSVLSLFAGKFDSKYVVNLKAKNVLGISEFRIVNSHFASGEFLGFHLIGLSEPDYPDNILFGEDAKMTYSSNVPIVSGRINYNLYCF